jgi:3-oxoacyl-[acyl-carrier-protein] synthase-3
VRPPAILGLGHRLPSKVVTNEDVAVRCGVAASAVSCPIPQRYYAEVGTGPSDLAADAARMALTRAGLQARDVELLLFATMTPDVAFPGSGCFLQDKLGVEPIGALDVRGQCLGFLFGLAVASEFLRSGVYERVLLAVGEVHSTSLDFSPNGLGVTPYFGDGAAAALLSGGDESRGILATVLHTDASDYEQFWCAYPAGRQYPVRMTLDDFRAGRHYPEIRFDALNPLADRLLREVVGEVLERAGCRPDDVAHYFLHYVDPRVALAAAVGLGIGPERATATAARTGHVGAASLPIALSQAWGAGAVRSGDLVCLAGVGAGINWGAAVIRL